MNQQLRKNSFNLLILLAVGLSVFAAISANSGERFKASPTTVAVIDWLNMTDKIDAWVQIKIELKDKQDALVAEMDQRSQQIKAKQEELKILPKEGAAFEAATQSLRSLIAQTNTWAELERNGVAENELRAQLSLYQDIVTATRKVAERDGWDLVFWNDSPSKTIDLSRLTDSAQLISTRQVFYASEAIDITDAVIAYMNNHDPVTADNTDQ